jgi:DNA-binding MltR family transcriptional regulator
MTACLLMLLGDFYDTYNAYSFLITSNEIRKEVIKVWKKVFTKKRYGVNVVTPFSLSNINRNNNI